jgi:hypothetical protein
MKSVSGVLKLDAGTIFFDDRRLDQMRAHRVVELGIALVPEGRRLFARLSVKQNLTLGAYTRKSPEHREATLKKIFEIFPVLASRQNQYAGTLSGGEQQMLAIARGLMSKPKPHAGRALHGIMPKLITEIRDDPAGQPGRRAHNPARGAERPGGHGSRPLRLHPANGAHRDGRESPPDLPQTDLIKKAYLGL